MKFKTVTIDDASFLYKLLKNRRSEENISHVELPEYEYHHNFVKTHYYKDWFIVDDIGSIYITHEGNIGVHTFNNYKDRVIDIIDEFIKFYKVKKLSINISPENINLESSLINNGFKLVQKTYKKTDL